MDKSTKARTIIGIIVLILANTAAGGAGGVPPRWLISQMYS